MNLPKVLAIYLPQFHETDNNNIWWGKGFTDWVSVKQAYPLFTDHIQPRKPLNGEYYDLSDVRVMKDQAVLAQKYGVDGFVFYHYYFDTNNMELYKPVENYLQNKDIWFPFCFCWANESWVRTWSKIEGNVWGEKVESSKENDGTGILALQKYGGYEEWKAHFEYMLPFFLDERYIKVNQKPMMILYAPENIPCLNDMVHVWQELAIQSGFGGIYVVGSNTDSCHECMDAVMFNEPTLGMNKMREKGNFTIRDGVTCFDYKEYWNEVLGTMPIVGGQTLFSTTVGYDTTPRRGRNGECFINWTPDIFREGLEQLMIKCVECGSQFLLINAWNEWGEGMYLEPDSVNEYSFLEAVSQAKKQVSETEICKKEELKLPEHVIAEFDSLKFSASKLKAQYNLVSSWLAMEQAGENIFGDYLRKMGMTDVAIYGYSALGKLLRVQLEKEGIKVLFAIDRYVGDNKEDISVYRVEEKFPKVNLIILTVFGTASVEEKLRRKYDGKILTIWELFELAGV